MTIRLGGGYGLEAGRQVRRLTDDVTLLRRALADQVADNDEPAGDPDPRRQGLWQVERGDRIDDREAGAHRTLGVVLMGLWVTEIDEHAIAHVFGDKPGEAR